MAKRKNKKLLPKIGSRRVKSQFEYDTWKVLKNLLPPKSSLDYESESLAYTVQHNYTPDFVIEKKDGSKIYIETKGLGRGFDYPARRKMEEIRKQYPDIDIRIIFTSDRPFRKGGKMRPSDWAVKNGYKFCIQEVPKDWFNE